MPKTIDDFFADWEASVFGFGYGTGEPIIIAALAKFLAACEPDGCYKHHVVEKACGPEVAWLLINRLCGHEAGTINYGTSPRFGWLDRPQGIALRDYFATRTVDAIVGDITSRDDDYVPCYFDICNCDDTSCCANPFFPDYRPSIVAKRRLPER